MFGEGRASIIAWTHSKPGLEVFRRVMSAAEELAATRGIEEVFVQTWEEYGSVLAASGYRLAGRTL